MNSTEMFNSINKGVPNYIPIEINVKTLIKPIAIYYGNRISPINKKRLHMLAQKKGINEYDMIIDPASPKYEMKYALYINGSEDWCKIASGI